MTRFCGRSTALFAALTASRSTSLRNRVIKAITPLDRPPWPHVDLVGVAPEALDRDPAEGIDWVPFVRMALKVRSKALNIGRVQRSLAALDALADGAADLAENLPTEPEPRQAPAQKGLHASFRMSFDHRRFLPSKEEGGYDHKLRTLARSSTCGSGAGVGIRNGRRSHACRNSS